MCKELNKFTKIKSIFYSDDEQKIYSKNQVTIIISTALFVFLLLIIIWLLTAHNDANFASHFSFASTVASIILSVLAIFMSISGEAKTQIIRDKIEQEANDIVHVSDKLEAKITDLYSKIEVVVQNTSNSRAKLNENPTKPTLTSQIYPPSFSNQLQ